MLKIKHNDISILDSPIQFREKIIELIKNAEKRIFITALYIQNDEAGREILELISERKRLVPDLQVEIFVDFHRAQRGLIGDDNQEGNNVLYSKYVSNESSPLNIYGVPVKIYEAFGVLHMKGYIFDNTLLYTGASLNNVYLHKFDKYRLDRYFIIDSRPLTDCMCSYLKKYFLSNDSLVKFSNANKTNSKSIKEKIKVFVKHLRSSTYDSLNYCKGGKGDICIQPIIGFGKKENHLNNIILELIRKAEVSLKIYTPYFNMPRTILKELKKAIQRGIKITIIAGDKTANDFYIDPEKPFNKIGVLPYLYEMNMKKFLDKYHSYIESNMLSILLWKDGTNSFHLKGVETDEKYYLFTGHNLNPRAWNLDLENGLLVSDLNKTMKESLEKEFSFITQNTTKIIHSNEMECLDDYPEQVRRYIKNIRRIKLDLLVKKLL
ncbi:MAG: CDP-diacylglycerol--serine O-phosphatidyltransferase [Candidatus Delongbacteria bacterium]|nr:CDP-diacylglycerol--serine O-phosphatidyltransferase [Candidatus Delongbacteria bacterium]MBN2835579.1 CDP-diacylglycerol--serine O-phosphatidyltransferase [Candidatus Delongbacteria bacterium]